MQFKHVHVPVFRKSLVFLREEEELKAKRSQASLAPASSAILEAAVRGGRMSPSRLVAPGSRRALFLQGKKEEGVEELAPASGPGGCPESHSKGGTSRHHRSVSSSGGFSLTLGRASMALESAPTAGVTAGPQVPFRPQVSARASRRRAPTVADFFEGGRAKREAELSTLR